MFASALAATALLAPVSARAEEADAAGETAASPGEKTAPSLDDLAARLEKLENRADERPAPSRLETGHGAGIGPATGFMGSLNSEVYLYTEYSWFNEKGKVSTFDNHYFHFGLNGAWSEEVSFHASVEWEHADAEVFVEEGYLDFNFFNDYSRFRVGRLIAPFNVFDDYHDNVANHFISRPRPVREITGSAWKDAGLQWLSAVPVTDQFGLNLTAALLNGRGEGKDLRSTRQSRDNNDSKTVVGRAGALILDRITVGGTASQGEYDARDRLRLAMWGGYARWDFDQVSLYGEYLAARAEAPRPSDPYHQSNGYFLWATYRIDDLIGEQDFRAGVRFDAYQTNKQSFIPYDPSVGKKGVANEQKTGPNVHLTRVGDHQWVFDISWLPVPQVVVKFDYRFVYEGHNAKSKSNNVFEIQVGGRF